MTPIGMDHLISEFGYGGMPAHEAELNMRVFADHVVPVIQRDRAFVTVAPIKQEFETQGDVYVPV